MSAPEGWPHEPFWDDALALYNTPGVEAACLELQRRHGLDVNLLLFCLWLGQQRIEPPAGALRALAAAAETWQTETVRPLRALRRRLKSVLAAPPEGGVAAAWPEPAGRLRAGILALEIDAEHIEQLELGRRARAWPAASAPGMERALRHLWTCFAFDDADRRALALLLRAAFPDRDEAGVAAALSRVCGDPGGRS